MTELATITEELTIVEEAAPVESDLDRARRRLREEFDLPIQRHLDAKAKLESSEQRKKTAEAQFESFCAPLMQERLELERKERTAAEDSRLAEIVQAIETAGAKLYKAVALAVAEQKAAAKELNSQFGELSAKRTLFISDYIADGPDGPRLMLREARRIRRLLYFPLRNSACRTTC
jgi:hypothetical protein